MSQCILYCNQEAFFFDVVVKKSTLERELRKADLLLDIDCWIETVDVRLVNHRVHDVGKWRNTNVVRIVKCAVVGLWVTLAEDEVVFGFGCCRWERSGQER